MKKTISTLLILSSIVILVGACTKKVAENTQHSSSIQSTQSETAETKTVTDHAGNTVEIPVEPKRIASLSWKSSSILYELNANVIGSVSRINADGDPSWYGMEELFNISFADTNYVNYSDQDIEQIKLSKPDLIIVMANSVNLYDVLKTIAPVVLLKQTNKDNFIQNIAHWVGKEEKYSELNKKYQKRVQEVKAKFTVAPENQTIVFFHIPTKSDGKFYVYYNFGAFPVVARTLGFKPTKFAAENYIDDWGGAYNLEVLPDILAETNYVCVLTSNQTPDTVRELLDKNVPLWKSKTKAYKNGTFIILHGEKSYSRTFASRNYILNEIEKYAR